MTQLKETQLDLLKEYSELLSVMSEGFDYVQANLNEEAPQQVAQVFNDLLGAFEQINSSHQQMIEIFTEDDEIKNQIDKCNQIVAILPNWFEADTNANKKELLTSKVIPSFESWKSNMQKMLNPYILN